MIVAESMREINNVFSLPINSIFVLLLLLLSVRPPNVGNCINSQFLSRAWTKNEIFQRSIVAAAVCPVDSLPNNYRKLFHFSLSFHEHSSPSHVSHVIMYAYFTLFGQVTNIISSTIFPVFY